LEFGDYRQFAMVGLLESIDRYVPGGAAQFRTFATRRIQGAILNGLEHLDERLEQAAAWRRARRARAESLVPDQLDVRSADRLLIDLGEVAIGLALGFILEGSGMVLDPDAARCDALHDQVELRQLRRRLWDAVKQLPERERGIIELHYAQGRRFDEIAEGLDLSKGRVSQLHARAVRLLRDLMGGAAPCDVVF
jgi:RNA polymerase sigma factor for flagellar operon FliA